MSWLLKHPKFILFAILFLGIFLRTLQFFVNPPGLYLDEATAGYEAFSLLRTGEDRWGLAFPIYFVNWGSGQNVLYSYMSVPIISIFGLSRISVRLLSLFIGILTLPLLYVTVKRRFGRESAIVSMLLLAILPWHIMLSRWAQESNLLPFFLLLGIYTMSRALEGGSRGWIAIALMPWGLSLYAYALSYIIIPIMLALILLFYRDDILKKWKAWASSASVFALFAFPIILFLFKNFIVHGTMSIERILPFGIPLLLFTRLQYVASPIPGRWVDNFFFVINGLQEGDYRSALPGHAPIFLVFLPLCLVGIAQWVREIRSTRRPELFLFWAIGALPIFFLVDGSVVHFNSFVLPMLVGAVCGLMALMQRLQGAWRSQRIFAWAVVALVGLQAILFAYDYFFVISSVPEYESAFAKNIDRAITTGVTIAKPSEPILLPLGLEFSFIFTVFYTSYPPEAFHRDVRYTLQYSDYFVYSFGRFYVGVDNLPDPNGPFTYVLGKWDEDPCANPKRSLETRLWKVGRCE
jgi:4-amino-4-deoxy-L-arabinose transferase-like glycosyltransferase